MLSNLAHIPHFFLEPVRLFKTYDVRGNLRPDLIAGLTVAVILLPQAIAFALIAELPPEMGLYAAVVAAVVGALWGSSNQVHSGPTNAISLLVLSVLLTIAEPGTQEFIIAAGVMAVLVGLFQLLMGLARLGMLVNFVSHSVVVGFTAGAGVLIMIKQLKPLLGVQFASHTIFENLEGLVTHLTDLNWPTFLLGAGAMVLIVTLRKINRNLPGPLISMVVASALVYFLNLDKKGVATIGELAATLPPVADLPLRDLQYITRLSTGVLAIGAIALVETTAIARSIASQTGQRLASSQEFVGQGLANISVGFLSGYPVAGSFSRSAVNYKAGAKSRMAAIFSGGFLLISLFALAPLAVYLPRTALAGVLIVIAYGMIDKSEMVRIWRGSRADAVIMVATFLGTLFLHIEFAVLLGILLSFANYIKNASMPSVFPVVPDGEFKHFVRQETIQASCPQMGILKISGDLYFGAVTHIGDTIKEYLRVHPRQRFLLLRLHGVNQCDLYGVQVLEEIMHILRERGGDLYLMRVEESVVEFMQENGFYDRLGYDHFLPEEHAIFYLFHRVLDPPTCIYECTVRVFKECQNLPKQILVPEALLAADEISNLPSISPQQLQQALINGSAPTVVDIREPREFSKSRIAQAQSLPLSEILTGSFDLSKDRDIVLVCRGGWRSRQAVLLLRRQGYQNLRFLQGGMLAWEAETA
jgi:SulP family sulfate permease